MLFLLKISISLGNVNLIAPLVLPILFCLSFEQNYLRELQKIAIVFAVYSGVIHLFTKIKYESK